MASCVSGGFGPVGSAKVWLMERRVRTPDGVEWAVTVGRPRFRGPRGDDADLVVTDRSSTGFAPLVTVAVVITVVLLSPVLIESGRGWALIAAPLLAGGLWWWQFAPHLIELNREGSATAVHSSWVAGRGHARRVADQLATEIARTPDDDLTG